FHGTGDGGTWGGAFRRQRHQRRRIPQHRAIVAAAVVEYGPRRERRERRRIDTFGAGAVAEHAERRRDLRLGDRGRDRVWLGVGEVPQVSPRRGAIARQHVKRISKVAPAVLGWVF